MEMIEKQKWKIQTHRCLDDIITGFVSSELRNDDREGGISGVIDTVTIVRDRYFLEGGDRTYAYKPVYIGT